ncbi:HD domain-containing protein [Halobacterium litoreum]|uniref:HD domain-containing protein n=1 Tax=Halobacterium litoreum TaxID=2039234 RepID=A0ABD5NEZ9_9EURY|nr:HD domain-containing protein [Halobacterium litoreum]UHH13344.1 HD domain-containing protein [Halobacterium litoreum]
MRAIKDSVHDYIEVEGVAEALLDTPAVQRLRHIKQLSTVRLVYPSANHTRFEHSLGVYHLADRALDHLDVSGARADTVRAAALLHDVGHGPYGHQTEGIIQRRLGRHHDEVEDLLAGGPVGDVLRDHGLDPHRVAAVVSGEGRLGQLVAGELDVDRMDYLVRDAHHTGVPYGTIDHGRLLRALTFRDGELVLAEGNVATAESVLVGRALMNATVYRHHVSRIAGTMLDRAGARLLDTTDLAPETFARMTDAELLGALRDEEATADTARRVRDRDLFKRAVWVERGAVPDDVVAADYEAVREFERDIADTAGVPEREVVVDNPGSPSMPESSVRVAVNTESRSASNGRTQSGDGAVRRLDEQSPLVQGMQESQRVQWRFGVYAPDEHAAEVAAAAERVLGLDAVGDADY